MILSQLIRGAAEELASRPGELVDPVLISAALARAVDQAYGSVREPGRGDDPHRGARDGSAGRLRSGPLPRRPPAAGRQRRGAERGDRRGGRARARRRARARCAAAPICCPALREAGVVDAGGYALTVMLAGHPRRAARRRACRCSTHQATARITRPQHSSTTYRYCVSFAVTGTGLEQRRFVPALERLGDCGADRRRPDHAQGAPAHRRSRRGHRGVRRPRSDLASGRRRHARAGRSGARSGSSRPPPPVCDAVAVASGAGMRSLFESLGVRALDGGSSLAPTSLDLLAAIHASRAEQVVVLPNSPERARAPRAARPRLSDKTVCVVPSLSPQAGLAAAVALDPARDAEGNAAAMTTRARARPHRRGRARAARRRSGPLPRRRRGRLRRGGDRRLGQAPGGAQGGAGAARARRGADHLPAGRRSSAGRRDGPGARPRRCRIRAI